MLVQSVLTKMALFYITAILSIPFNGFLDVLGKDGQERLFHLAKRKFVGKLVHTGSGQSLYL